jgi:L-lactate dehydrogenase complex protein LldF
MGLTELGTQPEDLAAAARNYLRERFLRVKVGFSGANFAVAETGSVCVVESEGNGRMCVTLPNVLITMLGIEKIIPDFRRSRSLPATAAALRDRRAHEPLQLDLDRRHSQATARRSSTSSCSITAARKVLADEKARETLHCIRCAACLNACPVYRQTGGHAYGSIYSGPIGAILTPQLQSMEHSQSLPYASSLCGACYEVCPVKINIPEILIHLRNAASWKRGNSPLDRAHGNESRGLRYATIPAASQTRRRWCGLVSRFRTW